MGQGCCGCDHEKDCKEPEVGAAEPKCEVCGKSPCECEPKAEEETPKAE